MKKRKLSRMQLRSLLLKEVRTLSKRPARRRRQLNEGAILTALAYLGIGALTTLGLFVAYHKPSRPEDNPDAYPEYQDSSLDAVYEDIGRQVQTGKSARQAVVNSLKKNAAAASKISSMSQQNGGASVTAAVGPIAGPSQGFSDAEGDIQSRKYGAQDPVDAGYTGLGLPFPFGGSQDDDFDDDGFG